MKVHDRHSGRRRGGWLLVALACGLIGCEPMGYTARNAYRKNIRTVAVPIWTRGKDIYRREVEIRLTEAIAKRVELDTPYKITNRQKADTLLTGTIDKIEQATTSFNPDTGVPREIAVTFHVSFQWEDLRSGAILVKKEDFPVSAVYLPTAPFNEDFFLGSEDLMERLARRIVETMEADWGTF
ncbi:MAG: hypothetical protein JW849_01650 [Phycisphaerae bacterium]|nr:hypothetical protein [Phycisphaerae bacterium]